MPDPLKWYDDNADNPPWIKALAEVRRLAPREGWRYHHVQAIIVAIDQYAEAELGNREFFLNKPYSSRRYSITPNREVATPLDTEHENSIHKCLMLRKRADRAPTLRVPKCVPGYGSKN
jgi:hypothetical protein